MRNQGSSLPVISPATDHGPEAVHDFGWALGTLLRSYLKQASLAVAELPGGARAYQVMLIAASETCQNQAAIAERIGLDRTVMTYLVDGLEAQNLVKRTPDATDRRARHVSLTEEGEITLARLTERVNQIEHRLLSGLGGADAEQLRSLLIQAASRAASAPETEHVGLTPDCDAGHTCSPL